jgi:hypothetical protein
MTSHRCAIAAACFMDVKQLRQLLYWCAYTVVVPMGFVALLWVMALLVKSPNGSLRADAGKGV